MREIAKVQILVAVEVTGRDSVPLSEIIEILQKTLKDDPDKVGWNRKVKVTYPDGSVHWKEKSYKDVFEVPDDFGTPEWEERTKKEMEQKESI